MGLGMIYWEDEDTRKKNKVFYKCQDIRLWWYGFDGSIGCAEVIAIAHGPVLSLLISIAMLLSFMAWRFIFEEVDILAQLGIYPTTDTQLSIATFVALIIGFLLFFIVIPIILYFILTGLLELTCWLTCFIDKQLKKRRKYT